MVATEKARPAPSYVQGAQKVPPVRESLSPTQKHSLQMLLKEDRDEEEVSPFEKADRARAFPASSSLCVFA